MVVGAAEIDQHVALSLVVTDPLDEAAPRCIRASKGLQVHTATIFDIDRFGTDWRCVEERECGDEWSDHRQPLARLLKLSTALLYSSITVSDLRFRSSASRRMHDK